MTCRELLAVFLGNWGEGIYSFCFSSSHNRLFSLLVLIPWLGHVVGIFVCVFCYLFLEIRLVPTCPNLQIAFVSSVFVFVQGAAMLSCHLAGCHLFLPCGWMWACITGNHLFFFFLFCVFLFFSDWPYEPSL